MKKGSVLLKGRWAAWLLLSVFVPMMVLSVVHQHRSAVSTVVCCADCDHHVAHDGHFNIADIHAHDCVLCQFTTITFIGGAALAFVPLIQNGKRPVTTCLSTLSGCRERLPLLRAPPFMA